MNPAAEGELDVALGQLARGSACGQALTSSADVELGLDLGGQLGDVDHVGPRSCAADRPRPPADLSVPGGAGWAVLGVLLLARNRPV
jgi:hypothetical protein